MFPKKLFQIENILPGSSLLNAHIRADSRFAPSQWETALLCNDVSYWLGVNLESTLYIKCWTRLIIMIVTTGRLFHGPLAQP